MQTSLVTKTELKNSGEKNTLKWVSRNCHTEERERKKKKQRERKERREKNEGQKGKKERKRIENLTHTSQYTHRISEL